MTIQNNNNIFRSVLSNSGPSNHIPPIWFMRQAGRYLPEYREVRTANKSFLSLCKNPEDAALVTLQPIQRFDFDAAIMFSDILVIPEAMGMDLDFVESVGPIFKNPIRTPRDILTVDPEEVIGKLSFVMQTIANIRSQLPKSKSLIGFSGSPFTLACYMLEGRSNKSTGNNFPNISRWISEHPEDLVKLLQTVSQLIVQYAIKQIESGVDVIMLFDTWGGLLTDEDYRKYSFRFLEDIVHNIKLIKPKIPVIVFTKSQHVTEKYSISQQQSFVNNMHNMMNISQFDVIGVDHNIDMAIASQNLSNKIIQGNFNPNILAEGNQHAIKQEAKKILDIIYNSQHQGRYIFNLGHGILPNTDPKNVQYLIDFVRSYSA